MFSPQRLWRTELAWADLTVNELQDLAREVALSRTVTPAHLSRLAALVARAYDVVSRLSDRLDVYDNRLLLVDVLPDNAPLGALIRVRGDQTGTLYLGNGQNRPLSKLVPVAL